MNEATAIRTPSRTRRLRNLIWRRFIAVEAATLDGLEVSTSDWEAWAEAAREFDAQLGLGDLPMQLSA